MILFHCKAKPFICHSSNVQIPVILPIPFQFMTSDFLFYLLPGYFTSWWNVDISSCIFNNFICPAHSSFYFDKMSRREEVRERAKKSGTGERRRRRRRIRKSRRIMVKMEDCLCSGGKEAGRQAGRQRGKQRVYRCIHSVILHHSLCWVLYSSAELSPCHFCPLMYGSFDDSQSHIVIPHNSPLSKTPSALQVLLYSIVPKFTLEFCVSMQKR